MRTIITAILLTTVFIPTLYFYIVEDRDIKVFEAVVLLMLFISLNVDIIINKLGK